MTKGAAKSHLKPSDFARELFTVNISVHTEGYLQFFSTHIGIFYFHSLLTIQLLFLNRYLAMPCHAMPCSTHVNSEQCSQFSCDATNVTMKYQTELAASKSCFEEFLCFVKGQFTFFFF